MQFLVIGYDGSDEKAFGRSSTNMEAPSIVRCWLLCSSLGGGRLRT